MGPAKGARSKSERKVFSVEFILENLAEIGWQQIVMWVIGGLLIFLAIKFEMEPICLSVLHPF